MRKDIELDNEGAQQAHAKMVNGDLANQIYCDVDRDPNCLMGLIALCIDLFEERNMSFPDILSRIFKNTIV